MKAEWVSAVAVAFSAVLVPSAVFFAALQWRATARQSVHAAKAADAAIYQNITQQFFEINRMFLREPRLRAYFYDGKPPPRRGRGKARVRIMAAMLLDFMDTALLQGGTIPGGYVTAWEAFFRDLYGTSPMLQQLWAETREWYGPEIRQLLDGPDRTGIPPGP
ncbi:hypothetical protein [Streptomyces lucensis]|nr:hypothetical protein [Streptomyces lucensis]